MPGPFYFLFRHTLALIRSHPGRSAGHSRTLARSAGHCGGVRQMSVSFLTGLDLVQEADDRLLVAAVAHGFHVIAAFDVEGLSAGNKGG